MREGWPRIALGNLLDLDVENVRVASEAEYNLAGVYSFGRGLFERGPLLGANTSYKILHRLRSERLVMSKLKAWEGALAVVPSKFDGYVLSPEFPTFRARDDLDPRYLSLLCSQSWFWQLLQDQSQGMGGRRERVHPRRLMNVRVPIPPRYVQERITDLIGFIDEVAVQAHAQSKACRVALAEVREHECSEWSIRILGDLLIGIDGGYSPITERRPPKSGERGVLKLSAIRNGLFVDSESKAIGEHIAMPLRAQLHARDVLITRSNTASTVGDVCLVDRDYENLFLSDLTLRLHPRPELISPDFLVESLLLRASRAQIESAATGTSGSMKKISRTSIRALRIPLPPLQDQRRIAYICKSIREVADLSDKLARIVGDLRNCLLVGLLTGRSEIPDSYDDLLETAR
jgi:type I restriction enzyme, S subunit